jgi:hypothetical protein
MSLRLIVRNRWLHSSIKSESNEHTQRFRSTFELVELVRYGNMELAEPSRSRRTVFGSALILFAFTAYEYSVRSLDSLHTGKGKFEIGRFENGELFVTLGLPVRMAHCNS